MNRQQKEMKKYCASIERRLNLPKDVRVRVMNDFTTSIAAMREAGRTDGEIREELGSPKKVAADLNGQMKEFAYRKSPWRFVFLAGAVLSGLWLVLYRSFLWLAEILMVASFPVHQGESSSMGIIGGADGPTAIFVATTSTSGPDWDAILVVAVLVACTGIFLRLRKCRPKSST